MIKDNKETMSVAQECNYFWKQFCEISEEGKLYEKVFQILLTGFTNQINHEYIVNINRDTENDTPQWIEAKVNFSMDEYLIFNKWFLNKVKFVFNSENVYYCTSCELTNNCGVSIALNLYFTRIETD